VTRTAQLALAALALSALTVALPALLAPQRFFADFPFAAHWVDRLGAYNQHLTTDVGALHLAFVVLFGWAATRASAEAALAACLAWTTFSVPHLAYHVTHLGGFPVTDATAQTGSLALLTAVPIAFISTLRAPERLRTHSR